MLFQTLPSLSDGHSDVFTETYNRVGTILVDQQRLTDGAMECLTLYCRLSEDIAAFDEQIAEIGMLHKTSQGRSINPLIAQRAKALDQLHRQQKLLELIPAANKRTASVGATFGRTELASRPNFESKRKDAAK